MTDEFSNIERELREKARREAARQQSESIAAGVRTMRALDETGLSGLLEPPCIFCGYDGDRYWSVGTHAKDCPMYASSGQVFRAMTLKSLIRKGRNAFLRQVVRVQNEG